MLTAVLPNILEDALAVALAAAVGYLALLNLPLRRAEAKGKVERVAANFAKVSISALKEHCAGAAILGVGTATMGHPRASVPDCPPLPAHAMASACRCVALRQRVRSKACGHQVCQGRGIYSVI